MSRKKRLKLRTPLITFERAKVSLIIVIYSLLAEYVDPRPFFGSPFSKMLWSLLLIELVRQAWVYRLEVSHNAVATHATMRARLKTFVLRFSEENRFRIRRLIYVLAGIYAFGWMVDVLTTRCNSAVQCALLFPRLAVESLPTAIQIGLYIAMSMMQLVIMMWSLTKVGFVQFIMPGSVDVSFDDIYGQDDAVAKVKEQVALLDDDATVRDSGGYMPKGVLLWGPPGTGKSMLAKAAASASTKPLINVPPGAFASTFVGINLLKVRMLFRYIRKYSGRYGGVIVFIDEIDALGNRGMAVSQNQPPPEPAVPRGCIPRMELDELTQPDLMYFGGQSNPGTLESFLAGMDGMDDPRGFINKVLKFLGLGPMSQPPTRYFMLAATNLLAKVDPALMRPGRLGRHIHVTYPPVEGKIATYEGYLGKVTHNLTDVEIERIARNHYRGTGAEVQDIVNEAVLLTFRDGRDEPGLVTAQDIMDAMLWRRVGESEGTQELDESMWTTSVHEAGHAVVQHHLMQPRERIWFTSVEKRRNTLGMMYPVPTDEDHANRHQEILNNIAVSLGSRVAEQLVLGEVGIGHNGDGPSAEYWAKYLVRNGYGYKWKKFKGRIRYSASDSDAEFTKLVEKALRKALKLAWEVLETRTDQIEALAKLLVEKHTVHGDEIHELLDRMEADRE